MSVDRGRGSCNKLSVVVTTGLVGESLRITVTYPGSRELRCSLWGVEGTVGSTTLKFSNPVKPHVEQFLKN